MADKVEVPWDALLKETLAAMRDPGILLVARAKSGRPNAMTIGWGLIGSVWSQPIFAALVRPSRFTHKLIEESGEFTVNVLPEGLTAAINHCGAVSGRDHDKFHEARLTATPSLNIHAPIIDEAVIAYECRVVMRNEVLPEHLNVNIRNAAYAKGDFHTMFYGRILAVRAERGIAPAAK